MLYCGVMSASPSSGYCCCGAPCNMDRDFYAAGVVVVLCLIGAATVLGWCWTLARWGVGS